MNIVLVQRGTIEGYTALWVAKRCLKGDCEIIQIGTGDAQPPFKKEDNVLMFGLSYTRRKLEQLTDKKSEQKIASIKVFDNDAKVKSEIGGMNGVKVNLKQTAARMAWEHLRADFRVRLKKTGQEMMFHSAPWLVDYTDDPKLWKWSGVSQFFVKLAIQRKYEQTLEGWDELSTRDLNVVEEEGKQVAREEAVKGEADAEAVQEREPTAEQAVAENDSVAEVEDKKPESQEVVEPEPKTEDKKNAARSKKHLRKNR